MDKSKIYITIASVVGVIAFVVAAYYATNQPKPAVSFEKAKAVAADDHTKWSKAKKIVLVEYADLQCPACQAFHTFLKTDIEKDKEITDNVTMVYRHFPLIMAHPFANDAAYAAEAAGKQGKFFEMADVIYTNQATWAELSDAKPTFREYAEKLKLDMEKYDADVASDDVKKRVARDVQSGNEFDVQGTPTFYLDGVKVEAASFADFKTTLKEAVEKSKQAK